MLQEPGQPTGTPPISYWLKNAGQPAQLQTIASGLSGAGNKTVVASGPESDQLFDRGGTVKAVVIGESSGASMETIMAVYPRHKAVVDAFIARGEVIGIGPFADRGNMAIFRTREAAEAFARQDPFILEGMVKSFTIRDWNDTMLE
jgi:uncharacterized protein YciI